MQSEENQLRFGIDRPEHQLMQSRNRSSGIDLRMIPHTEWACPPQVRYNA